MRGINNLFFLINKSELRFKIFAPFFSLLFSIILFANVAYSDGKRELIEKGDAFFQERAEGHRGDWASAGPVSDALSAYLMAYEMGEPSEELVIKILNASYFRATYTEGDPKRQKDILKKAIDIGERTLKRYPHSAGINYWMSGLWGRWGEVNGIFASARKGVAKKVRYYAEKTIQIDPNYAEGGGYRALGRLHFKAPRIPFILSWPDKKKALKLLRLAVETGPDNLTNHLFYAESLYHAGSYEEALRHVDIIINAKVRSDKIVEMLRDKKEAVILKKKIVKRAGYHAKGN